MTDTYVSLETVLERARAMKEELDSRKKNVIPPASRGRMRYQSYPSKKPLGNHTYFKVMTWEEEVAVIRAYLNKMPLEPENGGEVPEVKPRRANGACVRLLDPATDVYRGHDKRYRGKKFNVLLMDLLKS